METIDLSYHQGRIIIGAQYAELQPPIRSGGRQPAPDAAHEFTLIILNEYQLLSQAPGVGTALRGWIEGRKDYRSGETIALRISGRRKRDGEKRRRHAARQMTDKHESP
ncbi:hypothetical protein O4H52_05190 [Sphingomonadaceae bacterium G21617-S1]|nr:hypothetical protein [Sphingomonadaceae bacterium G21617-S1]